ncbi:MAG: hypothetical protein ACLRTQ_05765 [Candidatus Borkfalkia sp.]
MIRRGQHLQHLAVNQLTVGTPTANIVINNGAASFFNKGKFVDFRNI